jgi:hypothetical protein
MMIYYKILMMMKEKKIKEWKEVKKYLKKIEEVKDEEGTEEEVSITLLRVIDTKYYST